MAPTTAGDIKAGIERFKLADRPDVAILYPDVCFASLEAVGDMPVELLVQSVLAGWRPEDHLTAPAEGEPSAPFPVATLVVSRDGRSDFHPELSNREPVELQVWADGRVTLEIEFQGVNVAEVGGDWRLTVARVLQSWAGSHGAELVDVFNDRARSLPDVWNATFALTRPAATVAEHIELGETALRTAELSMSGWGAERAVRELLVNGDVHAVVGWQPSAVLEFWPAPPGAEEADLFVADLCALANSVRGGTVIVGVTRDASGTALATLPPGDVEENIEKLLRTRLFPEPERVVVRHLPESQSATDRAGILVVHIPPQDDLLRPFLVHDAARGTEMDGNKVLRMAFVERDGTQTISRSIAAVHAAMSAGIGLLRGHAKQGDTGL